ncbi:NUDIX domain-containing protein [Patescibacteria group bacterium]|nr:NUDIX domain-containing protein [Patescibacteria group bacterium]
MKKEQKIGFFLYCRKEQKILLHFRDGKTKDSPYKWDCFGGEIENDETPEEALARELFEELRISVRFGEKKLLYKNEAGNNFYCINFPFDRTGEIILGEGGGLGWISIECVLKMEGLTDEAKEIMSEFKNQK